MTMLATDPPVSEPQRRAMWAAAKGKSTLGIPKSVGKEFVQASDSKLVAAGILFIDPSQNVLFLKRSKTGDHEGEWCLPAGKVEGGELPEETARREAKEEIGVICGPLTFKSRATTEGVDFLTFQRKVPAQFTPTLNEEHTEYAWAPISDPPKPLHPGVASTLGIRTPKLEKSEVKYSDAPDGFDRCRRCTMWHNNQCTLVIGATNPEGWCDRFFPDMLVTDAAIAFDKSVRTEDKDGRLHVALTHISKANVCPYLGKEIPDWEKLGLEPERVYQLLRDPQELAKAAPTFNNLPLLSEHVHVTAAQHHPELVIGSTGTDAVFQDPHLDNSLAVWVSDAIALINSEEKKQLSSAYYYRADMTPGEYQGVKYDGVMRDIIGNHVALVKEGRAGSDVAVGDSKESLMAAKKLTRTGLMTTGALAAYLRPLLAADAKLNLGALNGIGIKELKSKAGKTRIVGTVEKAVKGKLAEDAKLDDVTGLLDALEKEAEEEGIDAENDAIPIHAKKKEGEDEEAVEEMDDEADDAYDDVREFLHGKLSDDDMSELENILGKKKEGAKDVEVGGPVPPGEGKEEAGKGTLGARDKDKPARDRRRGARDNNAPALKPDTVSKDAMNAAIKKAQEETRTETIKVQREISQAEQEVRAYVGEGMAQDAACASDVYKNALEAMNVDTTDIHPSAYPHVLRAQKKSTVSRETVAADSAAAKTFETRFAGITLPGQA